MSRSPILVACRRGDVSTVSDLLAQSPESVNEIDEDMEVTPLLVAIAAGNVALTELLVQHGANVNLGVGKATPLTEAASKGHSNLVQYLLQNNADPNTKAPATGNTPLLAAVWVSNEQSVDLLLAAGAKPETADTKGYRPLDVACGREAVSIVFKLLEAGVDVTAHAKPLVVAADRGNVTLVRTLLERGAKHSQALQNSADGSEVTALRMAAQGGHRQVAEMLLEAGADPNATFQGGSALLMACRFGHPQVAQLLLDRGAQVNQAMPDSGVTPLFAACEYGHAPVVALLTRTKGLDLDIGLRSNGTTALMAAAHAGNEEIVRLLLQAGADTNRTTSDTCSTALILAASAGNTSIVKLLLDHGANPNIAMHRNQKTALHCAVLQDDEESVRQLLSHGAHPTPFDKNRVTPLHLACHKGLEGVAGALIEGGADVNAQDSYGQAPLAMCAGKSEMDGLKQLLLEAGATRVELIKGSIQRSTSSRSSSVRSRSWRDISLSGAAMRSKTPSAAAGRVQLALSSAERDFCRLFPEVAATDSLLDFFYCALNRQYGKLYLTANSVCFGSPSQRLDVDYSNVRAISATQRKGFFASAGIEITTTDDAVLSFDGFWDRDKVLELMKQLRKAHQTVEQIQP